MWKPSQQCAKKFLLRIALSGSSKDSILFKTMVLVFSIAFAALGGLCMTCCRPISLSFTWKILLTRLHGAKAENCHSEFGLAKRVHHKVFGKQHLPVMLQWQPWHGSSSQISLMSHRCWTWTAVHAPSVGSQVQKGTWFSELCWYQNADSNPNKLHVFTAADTFLAW